MQSNTTINGSFSIVKRWKDVLAEVSRAHEKKKIVFPAKHSLVNEDSLRYYLTGEYSGACLTRRQHTMLMYFLQGKTAKQIAEMEGLSVRTVEDYSRVLRIKFGVSTKRELIERLNGMNYQKVLVSLELKDKPVLN